MTWLWQGVKIRVLWVAFWVAALCGCVASAPMPDPESYGAKLYLERCSGCHKPKNPSRYAADSWPRVVDHMSDWNTVQLKPEERDIILRYLQEHAKPAYR